MAGQRDETVTVGVIAFNDFHGHLEAQRSRGSDALTGGAAWLASAIAAMRGKYDHHATVSAGDLVGASPIASSMFLDEPAIGAMNRIGLDFNAVGNHEFDRGTAELLRLQRGGCDKHTHRQPCRIERFEGAGFDFLAASTLTSDGKTLFPATGIRRFGKGARRVSVGFIGLTLRETSHLVSPDGIAGITFGDEADAIDDAAKTLNVMGADVIVVLIHQGGRQADGGDDPNGCEDLTGPIVPILSRLTQHVDVVVSGHTHQTYVCDLAMGEGKRPLLLTSAGSFGRFVTDIELKIDPAANRVVAHKAMNVAVSHGTFEPDGAIAGYVAKYADAVKDLATRPVGRLSGPASRGTDGTGGSLGNLIADAQLHAMRSAGAQIALTNPFGIRTDLDSEPDGTVTFGQIYAVQPFGNTLVTRTLTGSGVRRLLEQGLDDEGPFQPLAPSQGLAYRFDLSRQAGERIVALELDGLPIEDKSTFRVTVNSFLAQGGDGFTVLAEGTNEQRGGNDLDALEEWIGKEMVRQVPLEERTRQEGS